MYETSISLSSGFNFFLKNLKLAVYSHSETTSLTYSKIQIRLTRHDKTFGSYLAQALGEVAIMAKGGYVSFLPGVQ